MPVLQPKMLLVFEILLLRPLSTLSRTGKDILVFYIYSISYWKKKKISIRKFLALGVSRAA